jgi:tRNA dimethylallyltransferase
MLAPAILLMGPTGAGKSALAVALAEALPIELVSVDSAQVYRGLDIGTAKPDAALRARVPHHLLDLRDASESYSVGDFLRDARQVMTEIRARGRTPLLVGGTMLYFRALQGGLAHLPPRDADFRAALAARAAQAGWPALHAELARVDAVAAARIEPRDGQRIERALEVAFVTGRPLSALQREDLRQADVPAHLKIVLRPTERQWLHERLARRLAQMMEQGLLAEVEGLYARRLPASCAALRTVGYRQLLEHVAGRATLAEALDRALIATRQLAKRQLTWLRTEPTAASYCPQASATPGRVFDRVREWLAAGAGVEQSLC